MHCRRALGANTGSNSRTPAAPKTFQGKNVGVAPWPNFKVSLRGLRLVCKVCALSACNIRRQLRAVFHFSCYFFGSAANPFAAASHLPSRRNCGKFPFSNPSGRQQLARDGLMTDREARQTVQHRGMPPDESKDKALLMAEGLLRGTELSSAFPPKVRDLSDQN